MEAVTLTNISKRYGSVEALRGVSLSVAPGELFGIIGPDGAGKTSLFRILTTLLLADGGSASVCGLDVVKDYKAIRRRVGYMPGRFSLYPDLTVEENLNFFATVFHTTIEENYDLVRDIYRQIEPFRKRRAGALSGGMKQKLALSCALIHKPDVLFLDEPTTGVDPVSRKEFWGMLRRLKEQGITIIASTPIIDEARQCDRIAFINEGEIKGIDQPCWMLLASRWPVQGKVSACLPEVMDTSCSSSLSEIRLCGIPILRICIGSAPLSILTASCATLLFPVSVSEALSFAVPTVSISTVSRSETS